MICTKLCMNVLPFGHPVLYFVISSSR